MTRPLTEAQQAYSRSGTLGMRKTDLKRAQQIAKQRQSAPYERMEIRCVSCGAPREARAYPVCGDCTHRREVGLR